MCGGTYPGIFQFSYLFGLSPRVRGNRIHSQHANCRSGSIPACAGEPAFVIPDEVINRVYPRVCGGTAKGQVVGN